jgi:hypothetical protein
MALEQPLQDVDRLGIVALIPRHERQIIVGRDLIGLQPCALAKMVGCLGQAPLKIQDRPKGVLKLRIARLLHDQRFQDLLGGVELPFPDLRRSERILILRIVWLERCRLCQRRLRIFQQVHLQADTAEAE